MGIKIIYEPAYVASGWFQNSAGITPQSWWDRDLTSDIDDGSGGGGGGVIPIIILEPLFVDDDDLIHLLDGSPGTPIAQLPPGVPPTAGIWVELTASLYEDADLIFTPIAVRALGPPDQMLKNEVRRIR